MTILIAGTLNKAQILSRQREQGGYTLLELMIVIVVIGAITSIATLSLSSLENDPAEKVVDELRLGVELMSNEAIIRSEPLALGLYDQGYVFFRLDEEAGAWVLIERDGLLKGLEFDKTLQVTAVVNDEELLLAGRTALEPQVVAMPTGEITPFTYELINPLQNSSYQIRFDALGRVIPDDNEADQEQK